MNEEYEEGYEESMKFHEENKIHVIQVKVTKKFRDRLVEDAEKHFRSAGMHVKSIVTNYLDMKKPSYISKRYRKDFEDMENLE